MENERKVNFAKNLRVLMAEHNTKPKELAKYLGVAPYAVSSWRIGRVKPKNYEMVGKIADYFGVTIDVLFYGRKYQ